MMASVTTKSMDSNAVVPWDSQVPVARSTSMIVNRNRAGTRAFVMIQLPATVANVHQDIRERVVRSTSTIAIRVRVIGASVSMAIIPSIAYVILDLRAIFARHRSMNVNRIPVNLADIVWIVWEVISASVSPEQAARTVRSM